MDLPAIEELQLTGQSDGPVITKFLKDYSGGGHLAFGRLTELAKKVMQTRLDLFGIKYELYDRGSEGLDGGKAKGLASARRTILRRQNERDQKYESAEDIDKDMHDLAGFRIALYYPNDFEKVEDLITRCFDEAKPPQDWPQRDSGPRRYRILDGSDSAKTDVSGRKSRFPGYFARHYRVRLRLEDTNDESAVRGRVVEIQLMSLLMHTWSKMHHELIYKPRKELDIDEDDERLIDISNGIIIAGEELIRHIQVSLDKKQEQGSLPFENEQDFHKYMRKKQEEPNDGLWWSGQGSPIDREHYDYAGILYRSLRSYGLNTAEKVNWLIEMDHDYIFFNHETLLETLSKSKWFATLETKTLQLPTPDTGSPSRSQQGSLGWSQTIRLVRYYVWIISNAMRWLEDPEELVPTICRDFEGQVPSGNDFLKILHPKSRGSSWTTQQVTRVRKFCEHMLKYTERDWRLALSVSRLTWYTIPSGLEKREDEYRTPDNQEINRSATCPQYLVNLLDDVSKGERLYWVKNPYYALLPLETMKGEGEGYAWDEYKSERRPLHARITGLESIQSYLDSIDTMEEQ
ncbi:hypothetical protein M426DRAFT_260258 [Hypoxylon sp. CI-4A]|nr:hypothetical protein M426DRAFT_260258 [Hypoxylon sp. CI-4A]